jgi:hypothetical protein
MRTLRIASAWANRASDTLGEDPWAYTLAAPWSAMRKSAQGHAVDGWPPSGDCHCPDGGVNRVFLED